MSQKIKIIWNVVTTVIFTLVILLAVLLVGVRPFGFQIYSVLSDSTESNYHAGSIIYVKEVDYTQLKAEDPITYRMDDDTIATRRIAKVYENEVDDEIYFCTKINAEGIAVVKPIPHTDVIGKTVFTIPYLGYVVEYIQNPPGTYVVILAGALLLVLMILPDLLLSVDEEKEKQNNI